MNENTKDTTQQEAELEMLISDILRDIGIPCNLLGYRYVRTAIMLAVQNQGYIDSVVKGLYPEAARRQGTTPSRLERGIRHAIEVAWDRGNVETHDKIFGYSVSASKGRPTNSEFIAGIADYVKQLLKAGKPYKWRD